MTEQTQKRISEGKKVGGRPSKFDSINKNQIKFLISKGCTDQDIADFFEVNQSTLNSWKHANKEFYESLKEWKLEADAKVERSLYERALGYRTKYKKNMVVSDGKDSGSHIEVVDEEVVYPPDTVACIFWLKNRKPAEWRDKHEFEGNMNISAEGLMRILDEAKKKAANRLANVN